jgi:hypothetical protein
MGEHPKEIDFDPCLLLDCFFFLSWWVVALTGSVPAYHISIAYKEGVAAPFLPALPSPPIFWAFERKEFWNKLYSVERGTWTVCYTHMFIVYFR